MSSPDLSVRAPGDGAPLHVDEARRAMLQLAAPVTTVEAVALSAALGRVLAADVVSPINVPAHDNAAMDGWAIRGGELSGEREIALREVGTALAGAPWGTAPEAGECVRIMTGAVMPPGCDTVVPQEYARRSEDGTVFSTGDELRAPGQALEAGCIYDSNRYTLHGMLTRLGCEVIDLGAIRDEPALLEAAFRRACESADAVITSGGVSAGEADFTKQIMARLGDVMFWHIAMRPGRPMAFGRISSNGAQACLFGLPGNPVAVMVTFYFLVRPALLQMMGAAGEAPLPVRVPAAQAIRKKPGRTEYQRGILARDETGKLQVSITGSQGSGILSSMSQANCMVVLAHEQGNVAAGETVDVVLFDGLV